MFKKPLSFENQVNKLIQQGVHITNKEKTITILKEVNYYRFIGHALQFRIVPTCNKYIKNTSFEEIYQLYKADEKLRNIFRYYIEKIEIYYKTQISYGFSMAKCINTPYDQHYDEKNFDNIKGYREIMQNLKKEKSYYKDSLIVKHHKQKYMSKMPLWVIVELMSFSNVSKLYSSMHISKKQSISKPIGVGTKVLENHLHCMTILRNKCAHTTRLYNTIFNPPVKFSTNFLRNNSNVKNNTLFAYTLVLLKRLPNVNDKKSLINDITNVINEFINYIDLNLIGFPENYLAIMKNCL